MGKGSKERAKERRERRITEISLLRTMSYSNQRWWTSETVAVVTGGNRGIGFEIIRQLAGHGMTVVLTSRDTEVGIEAVKVLQEADLLVDFHQLDIVDPQSIKEFAEWIKVIYGGLDILVNNAGVNFDVGSENSVEHAEQVINTNYYGTKNLTDSMIPLMKPSSFGARIVNVSSRLGRLNGRRNRIEDVSLREQLSNDDLLTEELIDNTLKTFLQQTKDGSWTLGGWPQNSTVYSMSKLAVNCYSRYLARKLCDRPEGEKISVNCFCPGWVKTAMTGWTGNVSVEIGADTGVWLALLAGQPVVNGKFFAERREIHF
ncbi:carbonyl reductase [NADPH] 1-like [Chenopodium quinoa]|uniref:carbonyl reductase [NADPH] 1-like n=1 Tax=Chenopodium quinoa TaxID=63459 RepID=UPI000B7972CA|nr:carbonyl reductase [NADPH] 1-like [Chenopodium quinoa]